MSEGVAEYRPPGKEAYRAYVSNDVINKMAPSFAGRPVFVGHNTEADPNDLKVANGVVIESFFNQADGKHWSKFMTFDDKAEEAIRRGLQLSNCYETEAKGAGGKSKGIDYAFEVLDGSYHHMAIVKDPRYEDSKIFTPEEFKAYNATKEAELLMLANSNETEKGEPPMFEMFKREKVTNQNDLAQMTVKLPKSKVEKTITQLVNEADEAEMEANSDEPIMASPEMCFVIGEEKMTLQEMADRYSTMANELAGLKKAAATPKEEKEENSDEKGDGKVPKKEGEVEAAATKKPVENKDDADEDGKKKPPVVENADDKGDGKEKTENSLSPFAELDGAPTAVFKHKIANENDVLDLQMDKVARGKSRYGSGK
jgi:hypothetical protein